MKKKFTYQSFIGITLILIGALFLLKTLNIYDTSYLIKFIPSLFLVLGIWALFRSNFRNIAGPFILILVFGTIQIMVLDLFPEATIGDLWPVLLVLIGIGFLINRLRRPEDIDSDSSKIDLIAVLGVMIVLLHLNLFRVVTLQHFLEELIWT